MATHFGSLMFDEVKHIKGHKNDHQRHDNMQTYLVDIKLPNQAILNGKTMAQVSTIGKKPMSSMTTTLFNVDTKPARLIKPM